MGHLDPLGLAHRLGDVHRRVHERVPSVQHADYVTPPPKYHPLPTHPVFEPQSFYSPPDLLDPPAHARPLLHRLR
jgi:hypothetical protein